MRSRITSQNTLVANVKILIKLISLLTRPKLSPYFSVTKKEEGRRKKEDFFHLRLSDSPTLRLYRSQLVNRDRIGTISYLEKYFFLLLPSSYFLLPRSKRASCLKTAISSLVAFIAMLPTESNLTVPRRSIFFLSGLRAFDGIAGYSCPIGYLEHLARFGKRIYFRSKNQSQPSCLHL